MRQKPGNKTPRKWPLRRRNPIKLLALIIVVLSLSISTAYSASSPVKHAQDVIRFFDHHRKAADTPKGKKLLWNAIHTLDSEIRSLQAVKKAQSEFPPHHALWLCIHGGEAATWYDHDSGHNGHYGGLQMSYNWLGYISGDAANYSQAQQEWAAEKAWAANGYSSSFLYGQWYEWDNADGCGTTG